MNEPSASSLDPRVLRIWRIRALLVTAAFCLATATTGLALIAAGLPIWLVVASEAVVVAAIVAYAVMWPRLSYNRWSYTIGEHTLEIEHGVIYRTQSSVPWLRIQNVDVQQGPLERHFGIVSLVIRTASASTDGAIPGIAAEDAESLRQMILGRVGGGDAV